MHLVNSQFLCTKLISLSTSELVESSFITLISNSCSIFAMMMNIRLKLIITDMQESTDMLFGIYAAPHSPNQYIKRCFFALHIAECAPGSFYNKTEDMCYPCPMSQYQNESGKQSCETCPNIMITRREGTNSSSECIGELKLDE